MPGQKISERCPFFARANIDFDDDGNIMMKAAKKVYLNVAKTTYLVCSADATTIDLYIGGAKKGEISASGYRAVE